MATRSYICMETEEGYLGIYCHNDGYLSYNGAMLLDHYATREKVERLFRLGDISSLNENLDPYPYYPHTFEDRQKGVTVFFHRDKGEPIETTSARKVKLERLNLPNSWIEYCYVFTKEDEWMYFRCGDNDPPIRKPLKEGVEEIYREAGVTRPIGYYGLLDDYAIRMIKEAARR